MKFKGRKVENVATTQFTCEVGGPWKESKLQCL
jgi:hypothetical protein